MGTDFIEKAAPTFEKSWDRGKVELATPDLFTQQPNRCSRTAAADIVKNASLKNGDVLIIRLREDGLFAMRGVVDVARFTNPATELLDAVRQANGIAHGTVERVHQFAAVAEISIC